MSDSCVVVKALRKDRPSTDDVLKKNNAEDGFLGFDSINRFDPSFLRTWLKHGVDCARTVAVARLCVRCLLLLPPALSDTLRMQMHMNPYLSLPLGNMLTGVQKS